MAHLVKDGTELNAAFHMASGAIRSGYLPEYIQQVAILLGKQFKLHLRCPRCAGTIRTKAGGDGIVGGRFDCRNCRVAGELVEMVC